MLDQWNLSTLISEAPRRVAILDSNLLLLFVSARLGLNNLIHFKRISNFSAEDALLLEWLLTRFKATATTSYVLAEASNLANELSGRTRQAWYTVLAEFATSTAEAHIPTADVGALPETVRFGITDAALSLLASTHTLITAEYRLAGYLEQQGRSVINFNHLKLARQLS